MASRFPYFLSFFFVSLFVCVFIPFVCLGVPVRFIAIPLNAIHWKSAHRPLRCGPVANAGRPRHLISILNQHRLITSAFHWLLIVFNHVVFHVLNDVRLMINSARGWPVENANCTRQLFGSLGGWCLFDLDWSVWVWFHRADWKVEEKQPKKKKRIKSGSKTAPVASFADVGGVRFINFALLLFWFWFSFFCFVLFSLVFCFFSSRRVLFCYYYYYYLVRCFEDEEVSRSVSFLSTNKCEHQLMLLLFSVK